MDGTMSLSLLLRKETEKSCTVNTVLHTVVYSSIVFGSIQFQYVDIDEKQKIGASKTKKRCMENKNQVHQNDSKKKKKQQS
jgi:hypothetical protein